MFFPNGFPEITAIIKGKKVYDPRTSTTAWSDNPALCLRDYLTSGKEGTNTTIYNYGISEDIESVDDDLVIIAANVCDHLNYPCFCQVVLGSLLMVHSLLTLHLTMLYRTYLLQWVDYFGMLKVSGE